MSLRINHRLLILGIGGMAAAGLAAGCAQHRAPVAQGAPPPAAVGEAYPADGPPVAGALPAGAPGSVAAPGALAPVTFRPYEVQAAKVEKALPPRPRVVTAK